MLTESKVYDLGEVLARDGVEFDVIAANLARGQTCSDRFLVLYEALERGYAEGLRNAHAVRQYGIWWDRLPPLGFADVTCSICGYCVGCECAADATTHAERVADAGYSLDDPKGYGL